MRLMAGNGIFTGMQQAAVKLRVSCRTDAETGRLLGISRNAAWSRLKGAKAKMDDRQRYQFSLVTRRGKRRLVKQASACE